jgi:hypothetical protein
VKIVGITKKVFPVVGCSRDTALWINTTIAGPFETEGEAKAFIKRHQEHSLSYDYRIKEVIPTFSFSSEH